MGMYVSISPSASMGDWPISLRGEDVGDAIWGMLGLLNGGEYDEAEDEDE